MNTKVSFPASFHFVMIMLGSVLFFYIMYTTATVTIPLTFSFVFSLFLYPFCVFLENRKFPRSLAIMLTLVLTILVISLIFLLISTSLFSFSEEVPAMEKHIVKKIEEVQTVIEKTFEINSSSQQQWIEKNLGTILSTTGKVLQNIVQQTTSFFSNVLFILVYMYFMLYYRHVLSGFLRRIIAPKFRHTAEAIQVQILKLVQKYIRGLLLVITIVALLNVTGLYIIGVKHALFFGVFAALLTIIPFIGVLIGSLLPVLYALVMMDSVFYPIAIFVWFQIVQALEGNLITPRVVGSQVSINPLIAILAFVVGGAVWGISGMILFVPLIAITKVFLDNIPSLEPYGYLLGQGDSHKRKGKE